MRFCGNCGTENTLGHPFCGNCGQDLRTDATSSGSTPPAGPTGTMPPTDRDDLRDSLGTSPYDPVGQGGPLPYETGPTGTMPPQPPPADPTESTSQLPAFDEQAPSHTHYADNPRHSPSLEKPDPNAAYQQGYPQTGQQPDQQYGQQYGWQQPAHQPGHQHGGQESQMAALAANPVIAKLLVGNWRGAGIVAGAALGIAAVLSLLLSVMIKQEDMSVDQTLTLFGVLLAGTFGAGVSASGGDDEATMTAGIAMMPLTLSLIALGAAVYLFRKQTAGYPKVLDALSDAARTALVVAVPLFFVSLVFRSDFGSLGEGMGAGDGSFGASRIGSLFMTFIVVFSVLAISCFMRRDWLPERAQKVHDLLAAPIWGFTALLVTLPVAGLVGGILLLVGGDDGIDPGDRAGDTDLMATMAMLFAGLPNAGYALIGLGSLVPVGFKANLGGFGPDGGGKEMERLAHWAENDPGLWLAPLVALGVLGFTTAVVIRRSTAPSEILRNLLCWLGLLVIALPLLSRFASLHGKMRIKADEGDFSGKASAYLGVDGFLMLVMVLLITALIAFGLALYHGALDWNQLTQQVKTFANSVQAHPAAPPQQPGQQPGQPQQWQQPPPPPQQQWQGGYPAEPPTQPYQPQPPPQGPPQQPPYQQGPPVYGEPPQQYGQQPPNDPNWPQER